jgi:hypothetical protein
MPTYAFTSGTLANIFLRVLISVLGSPKYNIDVTILLAGPHKGIIAHGLTTSAGHSSSNKAVVFRGAVHVEILNCSFLPPRLATTTSTKRRLLGRALPQQQQQQQRKRRRQSKERDLLFLFWTLAGRGDRRRQARSHYSFVRSGADTLLSYRTDYQEEDTRVVLSHAPRQSESSEFVLPIGTREYYPGISTAQQSSTSCYQQRNRHDPVGRPPRAQGENCCTSQGDCELAKASPQPAG